MTPEDTPISRLLLRPVAADDALHGSLFHLWWSAPAGGERLVQVYVNDELHTVTIDPRQRELWLVFAPGRPMRITLRAVAQADAWLPKTVEANGGSDLEDIASVTLLRNPSVPVGSTAGVSVDDGSVEQARLFGSGDARTGFGAVFGPGSFGIDAATGPGLGRGALGLGPLGADGEPWRWRRDDLSPGPHTLSLHLNDPAGRAVAPVQYTTIQIDRLPSVPTHVSVREDLSLVWS